MWSRLSAFFRTELFKPVDIASLVVFRIAFGVLMAGSLFKMAVSGRGHRNYIAPVFQFHYFGFEWVNPLPAPLMYAVWGIMILAALAIAFGAWYRLATPVFALGYCYLFLLDEALHLNHGYLISILSVLLIFIPANGALSVDALRNPSLATSTAPAWCLWLTRFQIVIPYFFGAVAKINSDWLLHGEGMGYFLYNNRHHKVLAPLIRIQGAKYFFAWAGFLFDLVIGPALYWRRTRLVATLALLFFHLSNASMFTIDVFPWLMLLASTTLWPPAWPRRLIGRFLPVDRTAQPELWQSATKRRPLILAVLGLHVFFQLTLPLRHWFYPGDVNWHDQGRHFSWHMMLRHTEGRIKIRTYDPSTRTEAFVNPTLFLTPFQLTRMKSSPDRIHQFARFISATQSKDPTQPLQVRVEAYLSLNQRPPQLLLDPNVDLAAEPRRLGPAWWILPLTEEIPELKVNFNDP